LIQAPRELIHWKWREVRLSLTRRPKAREQPAVVDDDGAGSDGSIDPDREIDLVEHGL
jgi:hypothetical protein